MKVFLDTNVLVSAFASRGLCTDLFELILLEHELIVGKQVLLELRRSMRQKIKLPVARRAIHFLQDCRSPWLGKITRRRGGRIERLFWQSGGGYDRNIVSGKTLLRMIDYLHNNPVRRGLIERAVDWRWSSAAAFEGGQSPLAIDRIPWEWLADT